MTRLSIFQVLGLLVCVKLGTDIKATMEELRKSGVITEEEYVYIVGKIEGRLT